MESWSNLGTFGHLLTSFQKLIRVTVKCLLDKTLDNRKDYDLYKPTHRVKGLVFISELSFSSDYL